MHEFFNTDLYIYIWLVLNFFDSFSKLIQILMSVDFFVNIFSGMPHDFITRCTVHTSIVQHGIACMPAVVRSMWCCDTTVYQCLAELFPVFRFRYVLKTVVVYQAFEAWVVPCCNHIVNLGVYRYGPVAAVPVLQATCKSLLGQVDVCKWHPGEFVNTPS